MMTQFCPHCGQALTAPGAPFCSYCGNPVVTPAPPSAYSAPSGAPFMPVYRAMLSHRAKRTGTRAIGMTLLLLGTVVAIGGVINHIAGILDIQHATTILLAIGVCLFAAGITLIVTAMASERTP